MNSHEIRKAYLDFMVERGHAVISSSSLLPENDPTTLFTGSGMQPILPFLLGEVHPLGTRIVDSQKCIRTQDIDEVGDNRHTTFFEMLGNWSLGDYFKKEQISWIFEFLTRKIGLDPKRIYITVFRGNDAVERDEESANFWQQEFQQVSIKAKTADLAEKKGLQDGRIFYYDDTKNWWSRAGIPTNMPIGEPGGPDSEIFWDFGEELGLHAKSKFRDVPCHVNCDCGRFLEIGNNVFMAYQKTGKGFEPLVNKNVDFGGGLERLAAAVNDDPDIFQIDLFTEMLTVLENLSGKQYGADETETFAFRVILDHLRGATFLTADGAPPGNKDQNYFTRRLLRRAIRFAAKLGVTKHFCVRMAEAVIDTYREAYPDLTGKKDKILAAFDTEETQFKKTLTRGEKEMIKAFEETGEAPDGKKAFWIFETFGFPKELIEEMIVEKQSALKKLADKKSVRFLKESENPDASQEDYQDFTEKTGITTSSEATLKTQEDGVWDKNKWEKWSEEFKTAAAKHSSSSRTAATGKFKGGLADSSAETTALHTAAHLMLEAMRRVLGPHIEQRGSNINAERLRFDFSHTAKLTSEEVTEVEKLVNNKIINDLPVSCTEISITEAKEMGATGIFDDKYASLEKVKVYTIGEGSTVFSKEICGGPHVERTGSMGTFQIKKQESSSAGVRRIKAVLIKD